MAQEGDSFNKIAFIIDGGFRKFGLARDGGGEHTTTFCLSGGFATPLMDILAERVCSISIQAISDSEIALIDYEDFSRLSKDSKIYDTIISHVLFELLEEKEERERALLHFDAKERIEWLRRKISSIFEVSTKKNIASYLAINPSTLSRVLSE